MSSTRTAAGMLIVTFFSFLPLQGLNHFTLYASSQGQSNPQAQMRQFMNSMRRDMGIDQPPPRQQVIFISLPLQEPLQNQPIQPPTQPTPSPQKIQTPAEQASPQPQPVKPPPIEQPKPIKKESPVDPFAQERKARPLFFNSAAVKEAVKNSLERARTSDDPSMAATLTEYAQAIADVEKNKNPIVREQKFPPHVYEVFPRAAQFDSFPGNAVSAVLHDELRDVVQAAAELAENSTVAPAVKAHADGIFTFCELAAQQRNPDVAFALAEVGMHLLLAAQATQEALVAAQEQVDKLLIARAADTRAVPRIKPANYQSPYEQLTEKINAPLMRAAHALRDAYEAARRERAATSAVEPQARIKMTDNTSAMAAEIMKNFALPGSAAAEHEKMLLDLQASIDEQAARAQKIVALLEDMRAVEEQRTWVTKDYLLRRNGARPYQDAVRAHSDAEHELIAQPLKAVLEEVAALMRTYPSRRDEASLLRTSAVNDGLQFIGTGAELKFKTQKIASPCARPELVEGYVRGNGHRDSGGPEDPEEPNEQKEFQPNQPLEPPSFHNPAYLRHLAQKYAQQLQEIKASHPNYAQYHARLEDRNRGLLGSLEICGDVQQKSEKFPDEVYTQFPQAHAFDVFSGNAAQRLLHDELRENIKLATEAAVQFRDEAYIQAQIPAVFAFTDLARQQDNPEAAFSLSDAGFHLLNAAKMMSRALIDSDNAVGYAAGAVIGGGIKAIQRTVDHFVEFVCNPGPTAVRDALGIYKLGYQAFKMAGTIIAGSSQERFELWKNTKAAAKFIKNNPDELVAFAFQCYLPTPQSALRAVTATSSVRRLAATIEKQKQFYKAVKRKLDERFLAHDLSAVTPEGLTIKELKWATKPTEMMLKKSMGKGEKNGGRHNRKSHVQAVEQAPRVCGKHGRYEGSSKHNINSNGFISPSPRDGQRALDNSIPHPDKATARISVEDGRLVELKLTLDQSGIPGGAKIYHGFVHPEKWKNFEPTIRDALINEGLVDKAGRALF